MAALLALAAEKRPRSLQPCSTALALEPLSVLGRRWTVYGTVCDHPGIDWQKLQSAKRYANAARGETGQTYTERCASTGGRMTSARWLATG